MGSKVFVQVQGLNKCDKQSPVLKERFHMSGPYVRGPTLSKARPLLLLQGTPLV
jgi:hypothetical protein